MFKKTLIIGVTESDLDADYWKRLNKILGKTVFLPKEDPKIQEEIKDADCLLVKFQTNVDRALLDKAPQLKYIGVMATAYGTIDVAYAKKKGIVVTNVPGYSTEGVAELIFACILEYMRDLEHAKRNVREGNYFETGFSATEIKGKKFGIVGLGRIGTRTAEIAQGFGADVRYWSRNKKENNGFKYQDLDALLGECDFVSLHAAQTKETEGFINTKRVASLKNGAVLIVTTPVELVDMQAVEKRLKDGTLVFFTDHSDQMKPEDVARLAKYKTALMYPPIGYITKEARQAKQDIFVSNVESFLQNKPTNTVS